MTMINARTRALALSFLISVSLTACLGGGGKSSTSTATPPVASPAPAPAPAPTPPPTTPPPTTVPNQPPEISGSPLTSAKTNQPYAFQPTARDPDGDKVTFNVYNKPAWATFDPTTGKLAGTPSSSSAGKYSSITSVASGGRNSEQQMNVEMRCYTASGWPWLV